MQNKKAQQRIVPPTKIATKPAKPTKMVPNEKRKRTLFPRLRVHLPDRTPASPKHEDNNEAMLDLDANYISDDAYDEDEDTTSNQRARRSKRVTTQKRKSNNEALHRIEFLVANKTSDISALTVKIRGTRGLCGTNMHLQLDEWPYDEYFAN